MEFFPVFDLCRCGMIILLNEGLCWLWNNKLILATLQLLESLITRTVTCYDVIKSGGATKSSTHLKTENYLKKKIDNQFLNDNI